LRPGGRLSIVEPINGFPQPSGRLLGYDVRPIDEIADKVRARVAAGAEEATLLDFDEPDLFRWPRPAVLDGPADARSRADTMSRAVTNVWDTLLRTSGKPLSPTSGKTIDAALTSEEAAVLEAHLRPLVESGEGTNRFAYAYLTAIK
jgi:hypothetical protein